MGCFNEENWWTAYLSNRDGNRFSPQKFSEAHYKRQERLPHSAQKAAMNIVPWNAQKARLMEEIQNGSESQERLRKYKGEKAYSQLGITTLRRCTQG